MLATSVVDTVCGPLADALTDGTELGRRASPRSSGPTCSSRRSTSAGSGIATTACSPSCSGSSCAVAPRSRCRSCTGGRPSGSRSGATWTVPSATRSRPATREQAARWIAGSYLQLLEEGRIVTVDGWLDAMGPETVAADQRLAVVRAWTSHFLGRHADGDAALAAAIRAPAVQPMPDGTGSIEASAALIGAAFPGNDAGRMLACAERAFELEAAPRIAVADHGPRPPRVRRWSGWGRSTRLARPLSIGADLARANEMWMDAVGARALLARISLETGEAGAGRAARASGRRPRRGARPRPDRDRRLRPGDARDDPRPARPRGRGAASCSPGRCHPPGRSASRCSSPRRSSGSPRRDGCWAGPTRRRPSCGRRTRSSTPRGTPATSRPPPCRDAGARGPTLGQRCRAREVEVLQVLATGASKRQAAARLFVSFNTIHTQLRSIYRKLDVHSLPAAISRARELRPDRLTDGRGFSRSARRKSPG